MAFAPVDQRPGLSPHMVGGQKMATVMIEQPDGEPMVRVTATAQRKPERRVDEDQRLPP
jgi:hypothetical protein